MKVIYLNKYKSCNNCEYNGKLGCIIIGMVYCQEKYNWSLWKKKSKDK